MKCTQHGFHAPHKDDMEHNDSIGLPNNEIQGVHGSDIIRYFPQDFVVGNMLIHMIEEHRQQKGRTTKNDKMDGNLEFALTQKETLGFNGLASAKDDKQSSKHTIHNIIFQFLLHSTLLLRILVNPQVTLVNLFL